VKVLQAIKPIVVDGQTTAVRGQYAAGEIDGEKYIGYREEPGVKPESRTPTFAALRLEIDTERWRGVPFFIRSGKRLTRRVSEIAIHFKPPRKLMYEPCPNEVLEPNVLVMRLQPNDGVSLGFEVKIPGAALALTPGIEVTPVDMSFSYSSVFGTDQYPAYETLLLDVMIGDATLFTRTDEVEAAWKLIDPLLDFFEKDTSPLPTYPAGSWGPREANALIAKDSFQWRRPGDPPAQPR
jgi:glucose-6-phosphate 1-dehydrogenase